jgi:hypothetical protein
MRTGLLQHAAARPLESALRVSVLEGREQVPVFGQAPALGGCLSEVFQVSKVIEAQSPQQSGLYCN